MRTLKEGDSIIFPSEPTAIISQGYVQIAALVNGVQDYIAVSVLRTRIPNELNVTCTTDYDRIQLLAGKKVRMTFRRAYIAMRYAVFALKDGKLYKKVGYTHTTKSIEFEENR